ncbi:MAG: hypothetical protein ACI4XW_01090 [Candidatus Spyradocola sp.]
MKRFLAMILAMLTLVALLTGCTQHQALDAFNTGIEFVGNAPLVFARRLVGTRVYGQDCYTGSYRGDYEDFTGFECLFGGTSLKMHDDVLITCTITADTGSAELRFSSLDDDPVVLCEAGGSCETAVQLPAGSNYLNLITDGFTGSIELTVE